jgi:hypothetical protein
MGSACDIVLLGRGRIARGVAEGLAGLPQYRLSAMIGRDAARLPAAPLTIDAAGPDALRRHGAEALRAGELWTVGAAALLDWMVPPPWLEQGTSGSTIQRSNQLS